MQTSTCAAVAVFAEKPQRNKIDQIFLPLRRQIEDLFSFIPT